MVYVCISTLLKQFRGKDLRHLKSACAITTNTVITIVPWRVQNQKLSGHLEVQKPSKRACQNNRRKATAKFGIKTFSLLFIAFSQNLYPPFTKL